MDVESALKLMDALRSIPQDHVRPTFLEIAGYPHYENVCSNFLKFFLDPNAPHGLSSLCLDAILAIAEISAPQSNISIEREVSTDSGNRLDLLIRTDTHILGIENKLFHQLTNPLDDYSEFLEKEAGDCKAVVRLLLTLNPLGSDQVGSGFKEISYTPLIANIRSNVGRYAREADTRYLVLLLEFLSTIENLQKGTRMEPQWLSFFREHDEQISNLLEQVTSFKNELRNKVTQLASLIETRSNPHVRQWFYREGDKLFDVLVHDIAGANLSLAINTELTIRGWEIQMFTRNERMLPQLRELLRSQNVPFEERERLIHPEHFSYNEPAERIQQVLQDILNRLTMTLE